MQLISVLSAIVISMGGTPVVSTSTPATGEVVTAVPTLAPVHLENGLFVGEAGNPVALSALYNACTNDTGVELPKC